MQSPKVILVMLIAGIGDLVMASPSLRAIRNGHPEARIHLLTSTDAFPIARYYPMINEVTPFPIRELRHSKIHLLRIPKILWALRQNTFTLAVNLFRIASFAGALKMGWLLRLSGAPIRIGHAPYGLHMGTTHRVSDAAFAGRHIVDAMLEIASRTGGIPDKRGLEVFWDDAADARWERFFALLAGKVILGLNPGGDRETKCWPPERFAAVVKTLSERFSAQIVLLGGPADVNRAARIENQFPASVAVSNLAGTVPLDELPCVIRRLDLLITNDSGPMHIAAAVKTPLVALFGPSDPRLNGPYTDPERYRVIRKNVPCERPCELKCCPRPSCMDLISVAEVAAACAKLLTGRSRKRHSPDGYAGFEDE